MPDWFWHTLNGPFTPEGDVIDVAMDTGRQDDEEVTPQTFTALTHTDPPATPDVTVIAFEPWPDVIVQPEGTVQLYEATPCMACTL